MKWSAVDSHVWSNDVVFIVGGGSSLFGFDFSEIYGAGTIIAVNESAFLLDNPDVVVSVDHQFMGHRALSLQEMASSGCPVYLCPPQHVVADLYPKIPAAQFIRETPSAFSWDRHLLHRRGGSSGYGALNVAVLMGAKRIVLLGFDYKRGIGNRKHWHGSYTWPQNENWPAWARAFDALVKPFADRGIEVINASPDSIVTAFPKMNIDAALAWQWKVAA